MANRSFPRFAPKLCNFQNVLPLSIHIRMSFSFFTIRLKHRSDCSHIAADIDSDSFYPPYFI